MKKNASLRAETQLTPPSSKERPLAALNGALPTAPPWHVKAMGVPRVESRVEVEGASIEVLRWGDSSRPGVLLIHGMNAHAQWWGPVAPLLSDNYHIVSFSYSGMGQSDWRASYTMDQLAREAISVAEATGILTIDHKPFVIAHSFGGRIASLIARDHGHRLAGMVIVDSLLSAYSEPLDANAARARHYPTDTEALARFRFLPPQTSKYLSVIDEIARASICREGSGWRWCFDPNFRNRLTQSDPWHSIALATCPLAFLRGELSDHITAEDFAAHCTQAPVGSLFMEIPAAAHHIMADQPLALVTALRAIIGHWLSGKAV
ncbi:alpha/beta fold hydrolase [Sphingobium sp. CFD-2]|uniref:alpha/beta fold hydrolase n=1 Tax=Sphingobium sp. CFD-2 TaxID=2878542 RepID=UPI00214D087A|nr:alpha/beta hydrolase [Sphingobium sp. CFD-2]